MHSFEKAYQDACDSGMLPGVVLLAEDKSSNFQYSKAIGVRSTKLENGDKPLQLDTVLAIASCTKLMTAIAVLQCVERGIISLDEDVAKFLPELGEVEIITAFDQSTGKATLKPKQNPITLRNMLSMSSGLGYDLMSPLLGQWRMSRGEVPWSAATIEERCNSPLLFEPGTGWMYGMGGEWSGKLVERVTGDTLETYMRKNIWSPLDANDITFWPEQKPDMQSRIADISTWVTSDGSGKAVPLTAFELINGSNDCLGGGGAFATAQDYMKILKAVLMEDNRLLKKESYEELFKPQLTEESNKSLNDVLASSPYMYGELGGNVPLDGKKSWSLGGILSLDKYPGWMGKNALSWQGMPNLFWFVDREVGLCGLVAPQLLVLGETAPIKELRSLFHQEIYKVYTASKTKI